jgi:hypothetical protein
MIDLSMKGLLLLLSTLGTPKIIKYQNKRDKFLFLQLNGVLDITLNTLTNYMLASQRTLLGNLHFIALQTMGAVCIQTSKYRSLKRDGKDGGEKLLYLMFRSQVANSTSTST